MVISMNYIYFSLAAIAEIIGCYLIFLYTKNYQNLILLPFATISLILFAFLLSLVESKYAGKAYAAYAGIYLIFTLLWLFIVEKQMPTTQDLIGASLVLLGSIIIISGYKHV